MRRVLTLLALVAAASIPLWLNDPYIMNVFITTGIFIIAAMSLNLLLGYTGQLSLGHVAFFGIGAYVSALTSLGFDVMLFNTFRIVHDPWPVWIGLLMGVVVSGIFGYVVGKLSFRVRGAYFVIVTISFAEVVRLVALNWVELTQGPLALSSIPPVAVTLPGYGTFDFYSKTSYFYLVLGVMVLAYIVISRLVNSRTGRAMIALKQNESLAVSVGIDVTSYLVVAAVISASIAGASGALYAHYLRIIDPDVFLFVYTVTMVIMVVTGGKGTLAGPLVGGLIFGFIPVISRRYVGPELQWMIYGAFMIIIVFVLPEGIVPAVEKWFSNKMKKKKPLSSVPQAQIQDAS